MPYHEVLGFNLWMKKSTPFGLFAIVAVLMMSLIAVKIIDDLLNEEEGNPVVSMDVSYVDSVTGERTMGTIEIELFSDDAPSTLRISCCIHPKETMTPRFSIESLKDS